MLNGVLKLFTGGLSGKLLGVAREGLLAALFGSSEVVAASRIAQTSIMAPMNVATTDALSGAFLPLEVKLLQENPLAALQLYRAAKYIMMAMSVVIVAGSLFFGNWWVGFIAPHTTQNVIALSVAMLAIMALGVPFYLYFNLAAYVDMAHKGFHLSSIRASGQSVGLILGVLGAYYLKNPGLIAWGFSGAYILLALWALIYIKKKGYIAQSPRFDGSYFPILRMFGNRLKWLIWLPLISQSVLITEKMVSSGLGVDVIASVEFARLITETAILLLAVPIGLASLSEFAAMPANQVHGKLRSLAEPLLFLGIFVALFMFFFSDSIVRIIFERGAFREQAVLETASILSGLALGIWAQLTTYVLVKVLNARHRNGASLLVLIAGAAVTICARPYLAHRFGSLGLGGAVGLGFVFSLIVACIFLQMTKILIVNVVMALPMAPLIYCAHLAVGYEQRSIFESLIAMTLATLASAAYLMALPKTRKMVFRGISSMRTPL